MDFRFDEEQLALRDAIRSFGQGHFDLAAIAGRDPEPSAATWTALADMGVFGLLVPAERGGFGGAVEAAILFEQLGVHLAGGPLLWSTIAAPLIADVHTGARRATGVVADSPVATRVVIEHAAESDVVLVVHDDHVECCDPSALADPMVGEPLDPLTPATLVDGLPRGETVGDTDAARTCKLVGTVLTAAMLVGVAQGALDVAAAYALERHQFGVPIGSFQAVKHLLADMYVRTELARSAVYAAAAMVDEGSGFSPAETTKSSSAAKLLAGEAGITNGRTAVQVLGGMGFTWEMLPHYYVKRAWVLDQSFGTRDTHALAVSDTLGAEVAARVTAWT